MQTLTFLIGGLGLFLYGLDLASEGFRKILSGKIRYWILILTKNRFVALFIGIVVTFCFQSSSATTVLLVNLVSSSVLNLVRTLGIILGADIGTTLTIQLIAFRIDTYALLIFAVGVLIYFTRRYQRTKFWAKIFMGFGLIFYGMYLMKYGMEPLKQKEIFTEIFAQLGQRPFFLLLASMLLTGLIQSSAGTLAIAMALMVPSSGGEASLLKFESAIPIIFGANIGTCVTALLAGIQANRAGRQVAIAHLGFKILGVAIFFPIMGLFSDVVQNLSRIIGGESVSDVRLLANAHTLFNVGAAVLFIPFTQWVPNLIEHFYSAKKHKKGEAQPIQYSESLRGTPELALEQADGELQKMGKQVRQMLSESLAIFQTSSSYKIEDLWRADQEVDIRYKGLSAFLNQINQDTITEEVATQTRNCFLVTEELEHIGDIISKNLIPLAQKKLELGVDFSKEGFDDIIKLHERVLEAYDKALKAYFAKDKEGAELILLRKGEMLQRVYQLRLKHLERLHKGLKETLETSTIHLDVISAFDQINKYIKGVARITAGTLSQNLPGGA